MRTRVARAGQTLLATVGLLAGCQSSAPRTPYENNPLLQARPPYQQTYGGNDRLRQIAQTGPRTVVPPPLPNNTAYPPNDPQAGTPAVATAQAAPEARPPYTPALTTYTAPAVPDAGPVMPDPATAERAASEQPTPLPARMTTPEPAAPAPPVTFPMTAAPAAPALAPGAPAPTPVPSVSAMTPAPPPVAPMTPPANRTVNGPFGYASDYSWLQGEVDRHYRGNLELRYRSASEEDAFGGKVRLENDPRLAEFRPGDVIAIEGEMVQDPAGQSPTWDRNPRYQIRTIRLVERK